MATTKPSRVPTVPEQEATLGAWLRRASGRLEAAQTTSPRPEAERLAAHVLDVGWGALWSRLSDPLPEAAAAQLDALLDRRIGGEPLAYVTGSTVFYGVELVCGPGVLVPRPETETLVDVALELLDGVERPAVVDVGCGTGAIAIALAVQRPDAAVWATELSPEAAGYAQENIARTKAGVQVVVGDLLSPLPPELRGRVDLVVSNPPYVPAGRSDLVNRDVLSEPPEAVFAGPRGDETIARLQAETRAWLAPSGVLVCEVGTDTQADDVVAMLSGASSSGVRADHTGRPRAVWARW